MTFRVVTHPGVDDDLDAIWSWTLEVAGPRAARRRLDEIEAFIGRLALLPHRGTIRDLGGTSGLRTIPGEGSADVTFVVDDAAREVLVLAVTSGGADWMGRARRRL